MNTILIPGFNPGPFTGAGTNTYLISGEFTTLLDAATGVQAHLSALSGALGVSSLAQLLLTHAHADHVDGCAKIAERWSGVIFRKMPWPEQDRLQPTDYRPLADGDQVPVGDGTLRVVHTPGHSPDHLCFYDERSGSLWSGDLVVYGGSVVIPVSRGGNLSQYLASLRRVKELNPSRMLPAHGQPIEEPLDLLQSYLEHRQRREDQVVAALRAGIRRPDRIAFRLYEGLQRNLWGMAEESVKAHLMKLRDEGRARSDGLEWELN